MKIKEILELSQNETLEEIAKNHLTIGLKRLRTALKVAGCYNKIGVKGWHYDGDPAILEQSVYDFVTTGSRSKSSPNVGTNERMNIRTDEPTNEGLIESKERIKQRNERSLKTNEQTNVTTEQTKIIRKRSSFDLDVEVMRRLKIQAAVHNRKVYEIVEAAIKKHLDELEK